MKDNRPLYVLMLILTALFAGACKKEDQSNIKNLFTNGAWQLASQQVYHYVGDSQIKVDTILCDTTQLFSFNKDMTCSYTNFNCNQPTTTGTWSLAKNKLTLNADISFRDPAGTGTVKPFANAQMVNLGDFSLVIQTGDTQQYYEPTQVRTITRYAFIRQKTVTDN